MTERAPANDTPQVTAQPQVTAPPMVVVIIGAGLIGASIGRALTARAFTVHLDDQALSHIRVAATLGAGIVEAPEPGEVDLVVVAVPPRALAGVIGQALRTYPVATVTDVGSVKAGILKALWDTDAALDRYVGSHPMAGTQHSGPVTARADLFEDRTWVITPHRRSSPESVARVAVLIEACGARQVIMDVDDHDAAVARVSHLPHLMAVLMAGHLTTVPERDLLLAGPGLRDVTRIAGSDPRLWEQIVGANSAAVLAELHAVRQQLDLVISAVESDQAGQQLRPHLDRGVAGTRKIPGKHGAARVAYGQVVVEIPDTPGALGRLFADVGEAGVNVEDIAIEHDQVRQVGYLALSVAPHQVASLEATMTGHGWDVQP